MDARQKNPRLGTLLAVMTLAHTVASFCNLSIPPLSPFLREELNLSHAQVGMLMSFFYIGVVSASILFGWISDLLGVRWALILGLAYAGPILDCGPFHFDIFRKGEESRIKAPIPSTK
jgi:MFS family permease